MWMVDLQWRIQDFPGGGGRCQPIIWQSFCKTAWKKKNMDWRGASLAPHPLGSATDLVLSMFKERCCKTLHFTCIFFFIYFDHRCCVHIVQTQTLRTFLVKLLSTRLVISLIFSFGTLCLDLEETLLYLVTLALHHTKKPLRQRTMWH